MFGQTTLSNQAVTVSDEFLRISALPRRRWTVAEGEALSRELSPLLKTPNGQMTLLPVQAIALREAWTVGGLFCSISVSGGKTLLSLLLPRVWQSQRPALVLPAKLAKEKTRKAIDTLSRDWNFGIIPEIISYESLGVVSGKTRLEDLGPDCLIFDEVHKLKDPKAARTRRVNRYLHAHPDCKVAVMSGSTVKRSIKDYAHLIRWALRAGSPVPIRREVLEEWDLALAEKLDMFNRIDPGCLLDWCEPGEIEALGRTNAGRVAFARRLDETPGVVCHHVAPEDIGAEIHISEIVPEYSPAVLDAFRELRDNWKLPDGQELVEGCEIYRHARELALGFYYRWKYPAPKDWLERRKAFFGWVRSELSYSRTYDSPDELVRDNPYQPEWLHWKAIRDSYKPETELVWVDAGVLMTCRQWIQEHDGIVFTEHSQFGEQLAAATDVPYFGAGGLDYLKRSIEHFEGRACVASIAANSEGRDGLKRFRECLITSPMPNGPQWEQTLGRLHRLGTTHKRLDFYVLVGCKEQSSAFWQAMRDAELAHYLNKEEPKLLLANVGVTPIENQGRGVQWGK